MASDFLILDDLTKNKKGAVTIDASIIRGAIQEIATHNGRLVSEMEFRAECMKQEAAAILEKARAEKRLKAETVAQRTKVIDECRKRLVKENEKLRNDAKKAKREFDVLVADTVRDYAGRILSAVARTKTEERERYNEQFDEFCDKLQCEAEAKELAHQHEAAKLTKQLTAAKERIVDLQERLDVLKLASARRTAELLASSEFI